MAEDLWKKELIKMPYILLQRQKDLFLPDIRDFYNLEEND